WGLIEEPRTAGYGALQPRGRTVIRQELPHTCRSQYPLGRLSWVESRYGAVAVGRTYLLPRLSSGGASVFRPWFRFHTTLTEPDLLLQEIEIDRLGNECRGAVFACSAPPFLIAIGCDHHDRRRRPRLFDLTQQCQPVHSRHIDVGQDYDE